MSLRITQRVKTGPLCPDQEALFSNVIAVEVRDLATAILQGRYLQIHHPLFSSPNFSSGRKTISAQNTERHHELSAKWHFEQGRKAYEHRWNTQYSKKAVEEFQKAVEIEPGYIEARIELALMLFVVRRTKEAAEGIDKVLKAHPENVEAQIVKARMLIAAETVDAAIEILRRNLEENPRHPRALFYLALAYDKKSDAQQAEVYFKQAVEVTPQSPNLLMAYSKSLFDSDQHQKSLNLLETVVHLAPDYLDAWVLRGRCLHALQKGDLAIQSFEEALKLNPQHVIVHHYWAEVLKDRSNFQSALEILEKARRLAPDNPAVWDDIGRCFEAQKKWEEAIEAFQQAVRLNSRYLSGYQDWASVLLEKSDYSGTLSLLSKALPLNPKSSYTHFLMGKAFYFQDKYPQAIVSLRKAVELGPQYAENHYWLGKAFLSSDQSIKAIPAFQKAVELDPKWAWAHLNLGKVLWLNNKVEEATREFQEVITLDPKASQGYLFFSVCLSETGSAELARENLQKAKELAEDAEDWYLIGVNLPQDSVEERKKTFESCLVKDPSYYGCHQKLGAIFYNQREWQQALLHCKEARKKKPDDAQNLLIMADSYSQLGEDNKAVEILLDAKKRAPQNTSLRYLLAKNYMQEKKYSLAMRDLQEGLTIDAQSIPLLILKARLLSLTGNRSESQDTFQQLSKYKPKNDFEKSLFAEELVQKDDYFGAIRIYEELAASYPGEKNYVGSLCLLYAGLGVFQRSVELGQKYLQMGGIDFSVYSVMFHAYSNLRDFEAAQTIFQKAIDQGLSQQDACTFLAVQFQTAYFVAVQNGDKKVQHELVNQFYAKIEEAIRLYPKDPRVHFAWALALEAKGEKEKAFLEMGKLYGKTSASVNELFTYAEFARNLGKIDEALNTYQRIIEKTPDWPFAHYRRGLLLFQRGEVENGLEEYREALRLAQKTSQYEELVTGLGVALLQALLRYQKFKEATHICEQFMQSYPDQDVWYRIFGDLYLAQGDINRAADYYQNSWRHGQNNPLNALKYGAILLNNQKYEEAIQVMGRMEGSFDQYPQMALMMGVALARLSRKSEAMPFIESSLRKMGAPLILPLAAWVSFEAGDFDKTYEIIKMELKLNPSSTWAKEFAKFIAEREKGSKLELSSIGDSLRKMPLMIPLEFQDEVDKKLERSLTGPFSFGKNPKLPFTVKMIKDDQPSGRIR